MTFVHNPGARSSTTKGLERQVSTSLGHLILKGLLDQVSIEQLQTILDSTDERLKNQSDEQQAISFDATLGDLFSGELFHGREQSYIDFRSASTFAIRELKIPPGENALVVNGRVCSYITIECHELTDHHHPRR